MSIAHNHIILKSQKTFLPLQGLKFNSVNSVKVLAGANGVVSSSELNFRPLFNPATFVYIMGKEKQCDKCKKWKTLNKDNFFIRGDNGKWNNICRKCKNKQGEGWRKENRERQIKLQKKWRDNNPLKVQEYQKNNKEKIAKRQKIYRENNGEKIKEGQRKWYLKKVGELQNYFEDFVRESKEIHDNFYDYSKFIYINAKTKGIIICPTHGEFLQPPDHHKNRKQGCPKCIQSANERQISIFLTKIKVRFLYDYDDKNCLSLKGYPLIFDFYLPYYSLYIEYNGRQHYSFIEGFHKGNKEFLENKKRDKIKIEYCQKPNTPHLLIIPYWEINNFQKLIQDKIKEIKK